MSKVLITGASGFIGQKLKLELEKSNNQVVTISNKSKRIEEESYFDEINDPHSIDIVYHLAAIASVPKSWEEPVKTLKINFMGTAVVLEFCKKFDIPLVYVSSYIYGSPEYLPIDEDHPVKTPNPYAFSKVEAERLIQFYGDNFSLKYNIIRPFNIYGSVKNKNLLIPEIIEQLKSKDEVVVRDLKPKRDYLHIDDFVQLLVLVKEKIYNTTFNAGSGKSYSVKQIVDMCQKVWGTNLPIRSIAQVRKNEINNTVSCINKTTEKFNWKPKISFEEGLRLMKEEYGV